MIAAFVAARSLRPASRLVRHWTLALVLALGLIAAPAGALEVPALSGRVVDLADVLAPDAERRISEQLAAHEQASGQQFAVLTIKTLAGDSLEDFSIRVVERWQLGRKGQDDGLLLLAVIDDRRVRIEVGYGLEGTITDAVSARVIRGTIAPAFRAGDYTGGIQAALQQLIRISTGEEPPPPASGEPAAERRQAPISMLVLLLFLLPLLLPHFLVGGRRGRRRYWGGGFMIGGHGGGFSGSRGGFGGGGGFSGGGGGFGGGGASGSW